MQVYKHKDPKFKGDNPTGFDAPVDVHDSAAPGGGGSISTGIDGEARDPKGSRPFQNVSISAENQSASDSELYQASYDEHGRIRHGASKQSPGNSNVGAGS